MTTTCEICDQSFKNRGALSSHQRSKRHLAMVALKRTATGIEANIKAAVRTVVPAPAPVVEVPRIFVPSPQQKAVFNWVVNGRGNAFVEAVAGAGKTTTLIEACKLMKHRGRPEYAHLHSVAFAAYNTKIAVEIRGKIAKLKEQGLDLGYVQAATFHSFGFKAWSRVHPKVKVAENNGREKADLMCKHLGAPEELWSFIVKLVSLAKNDGVCLYWQPTDRSRWHGIIDHHDLADDLENPNDLEKCIDFSIKGLEWSRSVASQLIDFDDMIWMPITTDCKVWQHSWVLVDEAQDTNPARRAMARKMSSRFTRMVFVGDRHQAIYGFTGADNDAVDQIIRDFGCTSLPLTVTYRCPKTVVAKAREYVSHIEAHETAPEGICHGMGVDEFKELMPSLTPADAILCRKTAPIVALAFKLIRMGVACHVEGKDIGTGLIVLAKRWKVKTTDQLRDRLETFRDREVAKLTAKGRETQAEAVNDRVDSLLVLCEGCPTVDCVIKKIENMFQDSDGEVKPTLTLSTVHKSKGREWDRVFILGYSEYMPSKWARQLWQMEQEKNLIYVAVTRAQRELVMLPAIEEKRKEEVR